MGVNAKEITRSARKHYVIAVTITGLPDGPPQHFGAVEPRSEQLVGFAYPLSQSIMYLS
jgi:hypothetical protein